MAGAVLMGTCWPFLEGSSSSSETNPFVRAQRKSAIELCTPALGSVAKFSGMLFQVSASRSSLSSGLKGSEPKLFGHKKLDQALPQAHH